MAATAEIPHVRFSDFTAGKNVRVEAMETVFHGLEGTGFVEVDAPPEVAGNLAHSYRVYEEVFRLDDETKLRYMRPDIAFQRGLSPLGTEKGINCRGKGPNGTDLENQYEFDFVGPNYSPSSTYPEEFPNIAAPNVWIDEVPEFEEIAMIMHEALNKVMQTVLAGLEVPLGLEEGFFAESTDEAASLLRPLHYAAFPEAIAKTLVGACTHTDINLLTVLPASPRKGLWIKTREGRWIEGAADPGHMLIQVGDFLERMTGGKFLSAQHRVECSVETYPGDFGRVSQAFFGHMNLRGDLVALPHLAKRPEDYPTIPRRKFLLDRLRDIGLLNVQL